MTRSQKSEVRSQKASERTVEELLAAVPLVAPDVEAKVDNMNLIQLRRCFAPKKGFHSFMSRLFKYTHQIRVNLDEHGSFFWKQINGQRNLREIALALQKHYYLKEQECADAVMLFTKSLMVKHLINLAACPAPSTTTPEQDPSLQYSDQTGTYERQDHCG